MNNLRLWCNEQLKVVGSKHLKDGGFEHPKIGQKEECDKQTPRQTTLRWLNNVRLKFVQE